MIRIDDDHDNDLDFNENICCSHGELASCWYVLLSGAVFIQVDFTILIKIIMRMIVEIIVFIQVDFSYMTDDDLYD